MKPLIEYINESIDHAFSVINENFQSSILNDFFLGAKNKLTSKRPIPMLVVNSMKWKEMTDDDVVVLTPEDAYRRVYSHTAENNEFFVWSLNDGYMVVSVGKDLMANFAGFPYSSVRALYKSGEVKEVLEVKDWRRFDSSFLREMRRMQKANAAIMKADLEVATKTDDYYDKIFNDKDISMFADVTEKVRHTINNYKELLDTIDSNKDCLGLSWNYHLSAKFRKIAEKIEEMLIAVVEIQPNVNVTSSKEIIYKLNDAVNEMVDKFRNKINDICEEEE